jgi:hypothetical protein
MKDPFAEGLTASQRIAFTMGRPMPRRMTKKEMRKLVAELRREDAVAEQFYGNDSDGAQS